MDEPGCEPAMRAPPPGTFVGFAGTGGGEGVDMRGEARKSSKSSNDMDLEELSACDEEGEPSEDSIDSRGAGNVALRGKEENAENESSSSSS